MIEEHITELPNDPAFILVDGMLVMFVPVKVGDPYIADNVIEDHITELPILPLKTEAAATPELTQVALPTESLLKMYPLVAPVVI